MVNVRHRRLRAGAGIAAAASIVASLAPVPSPPRASTAVVLPSSTASTDYPYRVIGRARLLFFSVSDDDVGGARLTWRRDGDSESLRMLVGSEPERAPRALNEWAYTAEETTGDRAEVFVLRSLIAEDRDGQPVRELPRTDGAGQYRASCSAMNDAKVQIFTTTVATDGKINYRSIGHVLDRIGSHAAWKPSDLSRPNDAAPGFLTAISRLLRASVSASASGGRQPTSVPYVYNGTIYDLQLRRVQHDYNVTIRNTVYPDLLKGQFVSVRRRDKDQTAITVSYLPSGPRAGVPVMMAFRASWWLSLELQLDDRYDVPADPGADPVVSSKIRSICALAGVRASR